MKVPRPHVRSSDRCARSLLALTLFLLAACVGRSGPGSNDHGQSDVGPSDQGPSECIPAASIIVGIDNSTTQPQLRKLSYDASAPLATQVQPTGIMTLPDTLATSGAVRTLAEQPTGSILVGDADPSNPLHPLVEIASFDRASVAPRQLAGGGAQAISTIHGMCALANGNIIAGEFCQVADCTANANEYDAEGIFVRHVFATGVPAGNVADCVGTSDSATVFVVESDISGHAGNVVRLDLSSGVWVEASRFTMSDFDGGAGTGLWSVTLHPDGGVYFGPSRIPCTGCVTKLIRCPQADLTSTSCTTIGPDVPADVFAPVVEKIVQLPCTNDLLLLSRNGRISRYETATSTFTTLYELTVDDPPNVNAHRKMVLTQ